MLLKYLLSFVLSLYENINAFWTGRQLLELGGNNAIIGKLLFKRFFK